MDTVDLPELSRRPPMDPVEIAEGAAAMIPVLSDGVVTLRALREADLGSGAAGEHSVMAQATAPEMVRWTTIPVPYAERDARFFLAMHGQGWLTGGNRGWAVADAATDDFLGSIDLRPQAAESAEIGFGLGPWATGRGVASRALRLVLAWGFDPDGLALRTVIWRAHVGNWGSRRVAWKAGFRGFQEVRDLCEQRGAAVDAWIATVRADEVGVPGGVWVQVPTLPVTGRDGSAWVLRPWRTDGDEVEAVREACSDPLTQHWLAHLETPYTTAAARRFVSAGAERAATGESYAWALAPADGGPAVGSLSLFGLTRPYGSPELGWWAHPSIRGRGLMTAAVRAASHWAMSPAPAGPGIHRLLVEAAAGNGASAGVARAAGFTEFGTGHAEDPLPDGTYADCLYFELLRPGLQPSPP